MQALSTCGRRLVLLVAALAALAAVAPSAALAGGASYDARAGAPSGDGVSPQFVAGNPGCTDLQGLNGPGFGYKIANSPNGTFALDGSGLTGGAPSDPGSSVTVANSDNTFFDWSSSFRIAAVIVKGGPDANVFLYPGGDQGDTRLHSPVNPNTGGYYGTSHIEWCFGYHLSASKTANPAYKRTYTWTIDKSVVPASHSGLPGDTFASDYAVRVDRAATDGDFRVAGTITVRNPSPYSVGIEVSDGPVAPSCATTTLAAGASTTCSYSMPVGSTASGINTAVITSKHPDVDGTTASAPYVFGGPTSTEGHASVDITDSQQGALGSTDGASTKTFTYRKSDFACPTDIARYTDGVYDETVPNTATITQTSQSDSANVTVRCWAPLVSKTAAGTYDEVHTWTIEKSVTPASQSGTAGTKLSWDWTVTVSESATATGNARVSGEISVRNPSPSRAMTVDVSDRLSDGTAGVVDCDAATAGGQTQLTVPAGATRGCSYTAAPPSTAPDANTATAQIGGLHSTGSAAVSYTKNVIGERADVTDQQIGISRSLQAGQGPWTFTGTGSHTCSTDAARYTNNRYTGAEPNTATVVSSDGKTGSARAVTTYTCTRSPSGATRGSGTTPAGRAALRGTVGCASARYAYASVSGRQIRRVTFRINGRTVRTLTKPNSGGRYRLLVATRKLRRGSYQVTADVRFTKASRTAKKRLSLTFLRCARGVSPRFTG